MFFFPSFIIVQGILFFLLLQPRFNAGVSWDEENDLKRALLASLQETQAVKSKSTSPPLRKPMNRAVSRLIKRSTGAKSSKPAVRTPAQAKLRSRIQNRAPTQPASQVRRSLKSPAKSPSRVASRNVTSNNRPLKRSGLSTYLFSSTAVGVIMALSDD